MKTLSLRRFSIRTKDSTNFENGSYFEKETVNPPNKHHLTLTPKTLEPFFSREKENEQNCVLASFRVKKNTGNFFKIFFIEIRTIWL